MASYSSDIGRRLRLFGIDGNTKRAIKGFLPVMLPNMDAIAERFYDFILKFPEAQKILQQHRNNKNLQERQIKHWIKLFSCRLDDEFYKYSLNIGIIHYKHKVSPYLYIGGYANIQAALVALASNHYSDPDTRADVLAAITRLIALDMDLALSAYTREHWRHGGPEKKSPKTASRQPAVKETVVFVC